jgi:ABC-2 type transport system permease protein
MSKISTIIVREYLTRVKKKSFIIMTFVTPLLIIILMALPAILMKTHKGEKKFFAVVDATGQMKDAFVTSDNLNFNYFNGNLDTAMAMYKRANYDAIIYVPNNYMKDSISVFSENTISLGSKSAIRYMINSYLERQNLIKKNIDPAILQEVKVNVPIKTLELKKNGRIEKSSTELNTGLGFLAAFIIYFFIFIYGSMVMKGAMEEKTGRVVEIIVSSAKAFELMMGKIIGIALVAFTQFGIWLISVAAFILLAKDSLLQSSPKIASLLMAFNNVNFLTWGLLFLFFFIGGYLLYGSMFGAIGAAVDNETDTQQFVLPITLPLILAIAFAQIIIQDPSGQLATWFSIIPWTSPIIMMVRFGFGVPLWQLILSIVLLIVTFIATVWIAAKIYRIGILSYGKKLSYRDLWKWIKYKG